MTEEKKTEETTATSTALACVDSGPLSMYLDGGKFNQGWRAAKLLSSTSLVPARYQGKPEDCFVGLALAARLGMEPFAVLPDLYVVHGTPAMSGKLVIALVNKSGLFKGQLKFRLDAAKPPAWCEAYAVEKATGEEVCVRVTWDDVRANGWDRDGSKWKSMREQMFRYRAAAWFSRAYCPEVSFGLLTPEEVEDDMSPEARAARRTSRPGPVVTAEPPPPPTVTAEPPPPPTVTAEPTEVERLAAEPPPPPPAPERKRGRPPREVKVIDKTEPALPLDDRHATDADAWAEGRE
jgi:hypothetical protein